MMFLSRVKTVPKFLSVIGLIGIIVGGCVWYAQAQMSSIDDAYSLFINRDSKGAAAARRINRLVYELNYWVYRTIAETEDGQMKAANDGFDKALPEIRKALVTLRETAPAFVSRIDAQTARVERFVKDVSEVRRLGTLNQNSEAIDLVHRTVDPTFSAMVAEGDALADDIVTSILTGSSLLKEATHTTRHSLIGFSALGVLIGLCAAIFVVMAGITRPLAALQRAMARLASGDTSVSVPGMDRRDEIGAMSATVQVFKDNLLRTRQLEAETAEARLAAEEQRRAGMRQMADGFEAAVGGIIGQVSSSATELQATAQTMTATATQTASQSTTVAAAAEEAAGNVATVAAAAEELGSSVQEIGRRVSASSDLAQAAVTEADHTGTLVQELSVAVTHIGDVVAMISGIASQTNLLALNATIEAARAGEAGRGFAVVAAEVKELAGQTARATEEIAGQIARIQASTGQAVAAIGGITARIREISGVATSIAAAVEEQGAATQEIVRNVAQASAGTSEVTGNITGVAGAAEETGAAASQVLGAASELSRQSEHLSAEVQRFLSTVRAA